MHLLRFAKNPLMRFFAHAGPQVKPKGAKRSRFKGLNETSKSGLQE